MILKKAKVKPLEPMPFTPGMRTVFEAGLPKAANIGHDGSLAVLLSLLENTDFNGSRMIGELSKEEPATITDAILRRTENSANVVNKSQALLQGQEFLWKAKEQALLCKHTWVGTEHLVLALIADEKHAASEELASRNISYLAAKNWLTNFLDSHDKNRP